RARAAAGLAVRLALVVCSWAGSFLFSFGARATGKLGFAPPEAKLGVGLVVAGTLLALLVSFRGRTARPTKEAPHERRV
ncbi:MAG: hypothetical protein ACRDH9_03950, partial [Actinomycetota bacterium]